MKLFEAGDIAIFWYHDIIGPKKEAVIVLDTDVAINSSHGDMEWSYFVMDSMGKKFWVDEYDLRQMTANMSIMDE